MMHPSCSPRSGKVRAWTPAEESCIVCCMDACMHGCKQDQEHLGRGARPPTQGARTRSSWGEGPRPPPQGAKTRSSWGEGARPPPQVAKAGGHRPPPQEAPALHAAWMLGCMGAIRTRSTWREGPRPPPQEGHVGSCLCNRDHMAWQMLINMQRRASSLVHRQNQQMPAVSFQAGMWKHSAKNFQSPLTSTRAALAPRGLPAMDLRRLSLCSQASPSCLDFGKQPAAAYCKDHATTSIIESQDLATSCLWDRAVMGSLRVL